MASDQEQYQYISSSKDSKNTKQFEDQEVAQGQYSGIEQQTLYEPWQPPSNITDSEFYVPILQGMSVQDAIVELDKRLHKQKQRLVLSKPKHKYVGRVTVATNQFGLCNENGKPLVVVQSGRYQFLPHNAHKFVQLHNKDENLSDFVGLTIAQARQGHALVAQDPKKHTFIIRDGGFVAYGNEGSYKIIAENVNPSELGQASNVFETYQKDFNSDLAYQTNQILGQKKNIKVPGEDTTVATFYQVPANNVVILQKQNKTFELVAGQHVIIDRSIIYRNFFSKQECQRQITTQESYTAEGVPMRFDLNVKYKVEHPIVLAQNYNHPMDALRNPIQTAINTETSKANAFQFGLIQDPEGKLNNKSESLPQLDMKIDTDFASNFRRKLLAHVQADAFRHGINLLSIDILDRKFSGELGRNIERSSQQVIQNQLKASQIQLENQIIIEQQEGQKKSQAVKNEQIKQQILTETFNTQQIADAEAYKIRARAKAEADARRELALSEQYHMDLVAQSLGKLGPQVAEKYLLQQQKVKMIEGLPKQSTPIVNMSTDGYGDQNYKMYQDYQNGFLLTKGSQHANNRHDIDTAEVEN